MSSATAALSPAYHGPVWLDVAAGYLGTKEIPGPKSNPAILNWAKHQGAWIASYFTNDDIPWCALAANGILVECDIKGTGSLAARSFLKWGRGLHTPALGAVLVFSRAGGGPNGGHVGFYVGERKRDGAFRVRGGNQNNEFNDTWIAADRLIAGGVRWPYQFRDGRAIALPPEPRRVYLTDDGGRLSVDEA